MDRSGVDIAVAAPFPAEPMSRANGALAAAIGDRIVGVGLIRPGSPEATAEVDRVIDDWHGMKAVLIDIEVTFEYFLAHGVLSGRDMATLDRIAERKLPVYLHTASPASAFRDRGSGSRGRRARSTLSGSALHRQHARSVFGARSRAHECLCRFPPHTASPVDLRRRASRLAQRLLFASNAPVEHPLIRRMAFERIPCSDGERASMLRRE